VKSSVFWALVRKDLYLQRGLMIAMVVVSLVSFWVTRFGNVGLAIGGVVFLTANIAGGIFMAMFSLMGERKEQARMFALSLPISGNQYDLSKLASGYLGFGIPWLFITAVVCLSFLNAGPGVDRGMVVYALLLQCYVLAMYSVLLCALFSVTSDGMSAAVILGGNLLFSLFMMKLNQPSIARPLHTDQVVWTDFARFTLLAELIAIVLSVGVALTVSARRRDHV
jgi:hypothetical protein